MPGLPAHTGRSFKSVVAETEAQFHVVDSAVRKNGPSVYLLQTAEGTAMRTDRPHGVRPVAAAATSSLQ